MRSKTTFLTLAAVIAGLLLAASSFAYTIVFRDGSVLVALDKWELLDDLALVTLPSGTQTTFSASEIDLERTDELNRLGVTRGIIVERPSTRILSTPPRDREQTLADLAKRYRLIDLGSSRLDSPMQVRRTLAGNPDLFTLVRLKASESEAAAAIQSRLRQLGVSVRRIMSGTSADRLLLDITADSATDVFSALAACSQALLATREEHADLFALELILSSQSRSRAAQFLLTRQGADALHSGAISPADFFVQNVQF